MRTIAFDIGGTDVKYGIIDNGEMNTGSFPVATANGEKALPYRICDFIKDNGADKVALCAPGPFDYKNGVSHAEHKLHELFEVELGKMVLDTGVKEAFFIHDAGAFLLGMISQNDYAKKGSHCGITIGTGLGYMNSIDGKLFVNEKLAPRNSVWCLPWKDGICENYVSATAISNFAQKLGYTGKTVKEIGILAENGDPVLAKMHEEMGEELGNIMNMQQEIDGFETIFFGGNVVRSWCLFKEGFERVCKIPYKVTNAPGEAAIHGLLYACEQGADNLYV